MFILEKERGNAGERNIDEKTNWLPPAHLKPTTWACAQPGIKQESNQCSLDAQDDAPSTKSHEPGNHDFLSFSTPIP